MRISDWSSDVCSSDLRPEVEACDTPERSSVMVKMVGNMIELNSPTASAAKPATRPSLSATTRHSADATPAAISSRRGRSEERRGGKECVRRGRTRWWPDHLKKRTNRKKKHIKK